MSYARQRLGSCSPLSRSFYARFRHSGTGSSPRPGSLTRVTGRTVKADRVEAATVGSLCSKMESLAGKLVGLKSRNGSQDGTASRYSDLSVETDPADAEVIVNGISRGVSPLLVPKVPVGKTLVEGAKDELYTSWEGVLMGEDLVELSLRLRARTGRLFVQSSEKDVNVFLDGRDLGPLRSGLFSGAGLYWQGTMRVTQDNTVSVDAVPLLVGAIDYSIPHGCNAEITGSSICLVVSGTGQLENLPVGSYFVRVSGATCQPFSASLQVEKSSRTALTLSAEPADQPPTEVAEETRAKALVEASHTIADLEALLMKEENSG